MTILALQDIRAAFSEGMRACNAGLYYVGKGVMSASLTCITGLSYCGRTVIGGARTTASFTFDTTRAYYNLLGQYTFPIENNLVETTAPKIDQLNTIGQIALTIPLPLTLLTVFSSVTWIPLLGNSLQSAPRAFLDVTNLAWIDSTKDKYPVKGFLGLQNELDNRIWYRQIYGAPGYILGGLTGLLGLGTILTGRIVTNSCKSFYSTTCELRSLLLTGKTKSFFPHSDSWFAKAVLGFPGILIGVPCGALLALLEGSFRLINYLSKHIYLSAQSTLSIFMNFVLPQNKQLSLVDQRSLFERLVVGFPGIVLGLILSIPVMAFILLGRIIDDSFETCTRTFISCCRLLLHPNDKNELHGVGLEENDMRLWYERYILGAPGFILGLTFALPAMLGIAIGRFITNNWKTGVRAYGSVYDLLYPYSGQMLEVNDQDRSWLRKYFIGFPGLLIGASLGFLVLALKISYQAIKFVSTHLATMIKTSLTFLRDQILHVLFNSWDSGLRIWRTCIRFVLHQDEQNIIGNKTLGASDPRYWVDQYLYGFPGLIVGFAAAIPSLAIIAIGRFLTNNFKTGMRAYGSVNNLFNINSQYKLEQNDNRHWLFRYGISFPGLIIGGLLGLMNVAFIYLVRIVSNNLNTFWRAFVTFARLTLHPQDKVAIPGLQLGENDARSTFWKYYISFPGLLLGAVIGLVASAIFAVLRFITNNLKSIESGFSLPIILSLTNTIDTSWNDQRPAIRKYGIGFPGYALGLTAGLIPASMILCARLLKHSYLSWLAFSGSILNLAVGRLWFSTVGDDQRSALLKMFGSLGYVFALTTTLPLAMLIRILRFMPLVMGVSLALIVAPFILLIKSAAAFVNYCRGQDRFTSPGTSNKNIEQKFKNLYSSLNFSGNFIPKENIVENGNGKERIGSFVRKSCTFNVSTITEKVLNGILKAYHNADDKEEFIKNLKEEKGQILEPIFSYIKGDFLASQQAIEDTKKTIERVYDFIANYLQSNHQVSEEEEEGSSTTLVVSNKVPDNLYKHSSKSSWHTLFWGKAVASVSVVNTASQATLGS
jgi:hypothetical protein